MKTSILIIGGAGFIGNALVEKYRLIPNVHITVLDDYSTSQNHFSFKHLQESDVFTFSPNCTYIKGHSSDIFYCCDSITPSIVYHFGEFSRIDRSWYETDRCFKSNLYGTTKVLDYCVQKKAKLIYSASSAILGEDKQTSPYTFSKKTMVDLIKQYHTWFHLNYNIVYFYNVYGPGQIEEGPYSTVIGIFMKQFKSNTPLTIVEPGTQSRIFTHINDIVSGLLFSLRFDNEEIPIFSHDDLSILTLANMFPIDKSFLPARKGDRAKSCKVLPDILRKNGWESTYSLKEYIQSECNL
jgi:UDP-glucose 4-epimerase